MTMLRHISRPLPVLALLCAAMVAACDHTTAPAPQRGTAQLRIEAAVTPGVATLVVEITAADIPAPGLIYNLDVQNGQATGTVTIPAGAARLITISAYSANGIKTHMGQKTVDVQAGTNSNVSIELIPLQGQQPITATLKSFSVAVTPTSATIAALASRQLTLQVTDGDGNAVTPDPALLKWATSNPAVATVSSTGLVTGVVAGSATIMATYNGVGAASVITVTP